ncbi:ankyrin repeat domain-containing protein [Spartinivicinus ruber]|uniref:ankyrin repeat domain-containing protein n=1 Tax=Spartinivicinus ruber TaxID=2683272 RepID=UPI0013D08859|nr:ankyrin repeat domain-containing protein [Spartinivicinus ruber]
MPQAVSSFTPTFFNNNYQAPSPHLLDQHQPGLNNLVITGIRYSPAKHRDLPSFRSSPDFSKFEEEYRQQLAVLRQFSEDWQLGCREAFSLLETRLFDDHAYFGPMIDTLYSMGKESIDQLIHLLQVEQIPIHIRKNALQNLAQGVTVCSEGTLSNILSTTRELALTAGGLSESLQQTKEKAIEQIITEFVRNHHNPKKAYEIHYVNGYMNNLATDFGLTKIQDRYISEVAISPKDITAAYEAVQKKLNTKLVADIFLRPLYEEVEAAWQQYKVIKSNSELQTSDLDQAVSYEEYGADLFPNDENPSLHQKIEAALNRMDRKLEIAPGETHGIKHEDLFDVQDDSLQLRPGITLAALSLMRLLESKGWLAETPEVPFIPYHKISTTDAANTEILHKGPLFFVQHLKKNNIQQELQLLTIKDLLHLLPAEQIDIINNNHRENWSALVIEAINNTKNNQHLLDLSPRYLAVSDQWHTFFDRLNSQQTTDYINQYANELAKVVAAEPEGALSRGLLNRALKGNDATWLERLLAVGVSANTQLAYHQTPLMIAASKGQFDMVETLLTAGANLQAINHEGKTASLLAAENGHAQILDLLLTNDERSVERRDQAGNTALMLAAAHGKNQAIKVLLQHRANIDSTDNLSRSTTPLMLAAENGHNKAVQLLLKYKASTERLNPNGNTPLMLASGAGHPEIVNSLLKAGAHIESYVQPQGYTPLMKAAAKGEVAIVALLLSQGANIDAKAWDERTALMQAAKHNHGEVVRLLAENKADLEDEDDEKNTALMIAAEANALDAAKTLLEAGVKPNHFGMRKTWHPLTLAAKEGHLEMVKLLLEKGADIKAHSNFHTAEYYARKYGHSAVAEFLANYS